MGLSASTRKKLILAAVAAFLLCAAAGSVLLYGDPRQAIEMMYERPRIERSLKEYFAAEMSRDYPKVYRCLAPSSVYRRTHTYDQYLQDAKANPVEILEYRLVDVYNLRPNHDRSAYPDVKRFVQAEVDVEILFKGTGRRASCNYCFTFLKEGGVWLKG
jgi:hypothetical protein